MLVDEKEMGELGVGQRYRDEPRRGNRQQDQQAAYGADAQNEAPVALPQGIQDHRGRRQHQPDQALGQYRQRQQRPGGILPASTFSRVFAQTRFVTLSEAKCEHGRCQKEADAHVQCVHVADHIPEHASSQHPAGDQAGLRTEQSGRGKGCKQHAEEAGQRRPQSCRPVMFAENSERGRGSPVLQGGLFEILDAIQARGQPVAGGHHFARDL